MPGERLKRKRILGVAIEVTPGVAETLDAGDATLCTFDAVIQADIEYTARPKNGTMSQSPPIPGAPKGKATFKTFLYGGATNDLQKLFQGCGCALTGAVIAPQSKVPTEASAGTKTLTIVSWQHGKKKTLRGAQGTFVIRMVAGNVVMIEWEFWGAFETVADEALPAPTYTTTAPVKFVSGVCTLGAFALVTQKLDFDAGNELAYRWDGAKAGGIAMAAITDRNPKLTCDKEATLVADHAVYTIALASTTAAFTCTLTGVAFAAPAVVPKVPTEGERDKIETDETELILCSAAADTDGDDEWGITFS